MKRTFYLLMLVIVFAFLLCGCSRNADSKNAISDAPGMSDLSAADTTDNQNKSQVNTDANGDIPEKESVIPDRPDTSEKTICDLEKELSNMTNNDYINKYKAGDIIDVTEFSVEGVRKLFFADEINDETFERMRGKSYADNCTVERSELRYIRVLHVGFDGAAHIGELVVNKAIADSIIDIFYRLFLDEYPIEKVILIDEYGADDETSMADNNSSAFNFRFIYNTTKLSNHARGLAIDINPLYNPYVKEASDGSGFVQPYNATEYVDRTKDNPYYITADDECCRLFLEHGFTWGGDWTTTKDYQHFEYKLD